MLPFPEPAFDVVLIAVVDDTVVDPGGSLDAAAPDSGAAELGGPLVPGEELAAADPGADAAATGVLTPPLDRAEPETAV